MTAAALFAPLTLEAFLEGHWPNRAAALPSRRERLELFPTLAVTPVRDLVAGHSGPVHAVSSEDVDGQLARMVDARSALEAFDRGTSLCLGGVHLSLPEVRAALHDLVDGVGLGIEASQCNAYVSPAGEGVPWHFDDREVLVVQLQGSKRWELAPNREVAFPTMNFVLATGGPDEGDDLAAYGPRAYTGPAVDERREIEMTPGAAVFLPRGTWHRTRASQASLSLTFGLFTPTALDVLVQQTRRLCLCDVRFREPLALGSTAQRKATQRRLQALSAPLLQAIGEAARNGAPDIEAGTFVIRNASSDEP